MHPHMHRNHLIQTPYLPSAAEHHQSLTARADRSMHTPPVRYAPPHDIIFREDDDDDGWSDLGLAAPPKPPRLRLGNITAAVNTAASTSTGSSSSRGIGVKKESLKGPRAGEPLANEWQGDEGGSEYLLYEREDESTMQVYPPSHSPLPSLPPPPPPPPPETRLKSGQALVDWTALYCSFAQCDCTAPKKPFTAIHWGPSPVPSPQTSFSTPPPLSSSSPRSPHLMLLSYHTSIQHQHHQHRQHHQHHQHRQNNLNVALLAWPEHE